MVAAAGGNRLPIGELSVMHSGKSMRPARHALDEKVPQPRVGYAGITLPATALFRGIIYFNTLT